MKKQQLLEYLQPLLIQNKSFSIEDAANILPIKKQNISAELTKLYRANIIVKMKRGVYLPVQNRFLGSTEIVADPIKYISSFFPNSYIGGWSACSHHHLTEQIFNDTCLFVPAPVSSHSRNIYEHKFVIFTSYSKEEWGLEVFWHDQDKLQIADIHRSIIDIFMKPAAGGGILHSIQCFKEYVHHYGDTSQLISYLKHVHNRSIYKRLGYVAEQILGIDHPITLYCRANISKGYIKIDPGMECTNLVTKWNLFICKGLAI